MLVRVSYFWLRWQGEHADGGDQQQNPQSLDALAARVFERPPEAVVLGISKRFFELHPQSIRANDLGG